MNFKIGDVLVEKTDLGIPGLTLKEYVVCRPPYKKYRQMMVDVTRGGSRYSSMYLADRFEILTDVRRKYLQDFHERQRAAYVAEGE